MTNTFFHIFVAYFLVTNAFAERRIDPEIERKIDEFIRNIFLPYNGVNGLGLSIIQNDGEILYTTGYGLSDYEKEIPIKNDTQFVVGSITKSFTSISLLKALNERFPELGEGVLDTPIRKLFPEMNFTLIDRFRSEHGTVRDILAHRFCFPPRTEADWPQIAEAIDTIDETIYRQRYVEGACGIRTEIQYSNNMITVAGHLLSLLKNKKYEDAVTDLLKEIGMTNATFVDKSDDYTNLPQRAMPYYWRKGELHSANIDMLKRVVLSNPAGGLLASPNEMVQYLKLYLNLGNIDGRQVIPEDVVKWMSKPSMHFAFNLPFQIPGISYAYGLTLILAKTMENEDIYFHSGYYTPYNSFISIYPAKKIGIFTAGNESPLRVGQDVLHAFIYNTLTGDENATDKAIRAMEALKKEDEQKKAKRQEHIQVYLEESKTLAGGRKPNAEEIVGKYGSGSAGDVEVLEQWDDEAQEMRLFVKYGKWAHGWLDHVSGATYKVDYVTDLAEDDYSTGFEESATYIRFYNETLEFAFSFGPVEWSYGKFKLGVSLDKLPPIPWLPGSCGPDEVE